MRRGIAGVRLCDRPACPERWPCSTHGTHAVGDYEHLGKHAGSFELADVPFTAVGVLDMVWCGRCRYALCACPPKEPKAPAGSELPEGWVRTGLHSYEHVSRAAVWCDVGVWKARPAGAVQTLWGEHIGSREEAMAAALTAAPVNVQASLPAGWEKLESDRGVYFAHTSGARVWSCGAKGCVRWGYNRRYIPDLPYEAASCCSGDRRKLTRDEAMSAALLSDLPSGWTQDGTDGRAFVHIDGHAVRQDHGATSWLWWPAPIIGSPLSGDPKPTRDEAMAAALAGSKRNLCLTCGREPALQFEHYYTCCAKCRAGVKKGAGALRPGWTTDGESYFNDAIALMLVRGDEGRWLICGNGDPWPQNFRVDGDDNSGALGA